MHLEAGPRPVWLGVRGAHSAPREPRPKGEPRVLSFAVAGPESLAKASVAMVSFAGDLESVLLGREVWKRLSALPRDLTALPDPFPSTHPILSSTPLI